MAATGGQLPSAPAAGGAGLPVPRVRVSGGSGGLVKVEVPAADLIGGATATRWLPETTVSVTGVPESALATGTVLLELGRHRARRSYRNAASNSRHAGIVHPSHAPAPSGTGSHTHGGTHEGVAASIAALRETEWAVTANGDTFDVTQAIASFLLATRVFYRDTANTLQVLDPVTVPAQKSGNYYPGTAKACGSRLRPAFFFFRLSIVDGSDPRQQRTYGAWTHPVAVAHKIHPIMVDDTASAANGAQCGSVHPQWNKELLWVWHGPHRIMGTS